MTQEDKELLLKDLCARLPYGVKVYVPFDKEKPLTREMGLGTLHDFMFDNLEVKPYLRQMSTMTEKERKEYDSKRKHICDDYNRYCFDTIESIDWLNFHHFDYRGLIEKGLALEVTKENNPYGK